MKRYSKKREAILDAFRSTTSHPAAEWIYMELKPRFPDLSLATVYRNIASFLEEGELISVGVVDSKERYDADLSPHSHFICDRCGAVMDVRLSDSGAIDRDVEQELDARVSRHDLTFHGVCGHCLSSERMRA